ncbi:hypothetical protein CY0110_15952 [Crocosphaera chwakensis CCY0110]|uniref:Uncharacterized protein n=1 Tax=Crocosphaera chwakensis CCY0110 TaxID=391612 RepID=A3IHM2_9CHRO|nr:hypothetical protein CY0110_15952 [Crocosphaera chwakensis CCY0110]
MPRVIFWGLEKNINPSASIRSKTSASFS